MDQQEATPTLGSGTAFSDFDVIVVGAGVAGIAAGQKLNLYGILLKSSVSAALRVTGEWV
jgi:ribulose 1,5-bisphosphate synthetase/thiazole synthase